MKLFLFPAFFLFFSLLLAGQHGSNPVCVPSRGPDSTTNPLLPIHRKAQSASLCEETKARSGSFLQVTNTTVFQKALKVLQDSLHLQNAAEVSVAFGRNEKGDTITSSFASGGKRSVGILPVAHAFADLHTHPRNTPPSSGDVYGLLSACSRSAGYTMRFVLLRNGTLYLLLVQNREEAAAFLRHYPPQRLQGYSPLFPERLLDEFREARFLHGNPEEVAMAAILEKYKAGMLLYRQDAETLAWVQVRGDGSPLDLAPAEGR